MVFAVDMEYIPNICFLTVFHICEVRVALEILDLQGLSRQFLLLELVVQGMLFGVLDLID